jgi:hypothetical protein
MLVLLLALLRPYFKFNVTLTHDDVIRYRLRRERALRRRAVIDRWLMPIRRFMEDWLRPIERFVQEWLRPLGRGLLLIPLLLGRKAAKKYRESSIRREIPQICIAVALYWFGAFGIKMLAALICLTLVIGLFNRLRAIADRLAALDRNPKP